MHWPSEQGDKHDRRRQMRRLHTPTMRKYCGNTAIYATIASQICSLSLQIARLRRAGGAVPLSTTVPGAPVRTMCDCG